MQEVESYEQKRKRKSKEKPGDKYYNPATIDEINQLLKWAAKYKFHQGIIQQILSIASWDKFTAKRYLQFQAKKSKQIIDNRNAGITDQINST